MIRKCVKPRLLEVVKCRLIRSFFIVSIGLVLFVGFAGLGTWQVLRRTEKLALIARVHQRVGAAAQPAPDFSQWQQINAKADEYRCVTVSGYFLYDKETWVAANTKLGVGFWVMTPLRLLNGTTVLINRGFVPLHPSTPIARPGATANAPSVVTGLLRMSESRPRFLRPNVPAHHQWYTRDVQAIARYHHLSHVAPYFIDAATDVQTGRETWPQGGMTVIVFPNHHLIYALTWYALALMTAGASVYVYLYRNKSSPC